MACFQCEQRADDGCTVVGVCGKEPDVAALQDLLIAQVKSIGALADGLRQGGVAEEKLQAANRFTLHALFSTLTNVNFDADRFVSFTKEAEKTRAELERLGQASRVSLPSSGGFKVSESLGRDERVALGKSVGLAARETFDHDVFGALEMTLYGVKGTAAYAAHALRLGKEDPAVYAGLHKALRTTAEGARLDLGGALGAALEVGAVNLKTMDLLDAAHRARFGVPEPVMVNHAVKAGPAILVSGHDMEDLHSLLVQTQGKGINVYTHGEMLPAHSYPGLRKFEHLAGHYGTAWQWQRFDFGSFVRSGGGAILMTTNCITQPQSSYNKHIWTANEVGWAGVPHIVNGDYSPLIRAAKAAPGFARTEPEKRMLAGLGREAVLERAGDVVAAVKAGKLTKIAVAGGCDGTESARGPMYDRALSLPSSSMILTAGCAKYRLLKDPRSAGVVEGTNLPRLLDFGQCNDVYGMVGVASALAKAFNTDVNGLNLQLTVSWLEQKAVAVLLSLLHIGMKNIVLGPRAPAFVTPKIAQILQDNYNLTIFDEHAQRQRA